MKPQSLQNQLHVRQNLKVKLFIEGVFWMNKRKSGCKFVFLFILVFLFLLVYIGKLYFDRNKYNEGNSYLNDLKISSDLKLSSIEKVYGKQISIKDYSEQLYILDYGSFSVLVLKDVYKTHNGIDGDTRFCSLIFTDSEYEFSKGKPKIGSTKDYAMNYYQGKLVIKDIPPEENEFGYVIGSYYIYFKFNDENIITKIYISFGL